MVEKLAGLDFAERYLVIDLDLTVARADEEIGIKEGPFTFIYVTRVDSAFEFKLNNKNNNGIYARAGLEWKTPITEIWITNSVGTGSGQIVLGY